MSLSIGIQLKYWTFGAVVCYLISLSSIQDGWVVIGLSEIFYFV